jgi:hypothetical protein
MVRACSMHGIDENCTMTFSSENRKDREYLEDLSVDGSIILKCMGAVN